MCGTITGESGTDPTDALIAGVIIQVMRHFSARSAIQTSLDDRLVFFRTFLRAPLSTGSVTPSFRYLGQRMRRIVDEKHPSVGAVVEFGCGTGSVTRSFDGYEMIGLDLDERLLEKARRNCPFARFAVSDVCADDFTLPEFDSERVYLISCIPVVNLGERHGAFQANIRRLLDEPRVAGFMQFTYLPRTPLDLPGSLQRRNLVLRNLPPAFVYSWERGMAAAS